MRLTLGLPLVGFLALAPTTSSAQGLPGAQPNYLVIYREQLKPGKAAAHTALEAGWPAAYAKAGGQQDSYLAMNAMTGSPEVLFVQPVESFTAFGESMKRTEANAELSAELARLATADGELLSGVQTMLLVARKDLNRGAYPDLARQRFWDISTFRMKPGRETSFETAAKAYAAAADRTGSSASWRIYQVMAGMQGPTFMIFSSVTSYGEFDATMEDGNKIWGGRTDLERALFDKFGEDLVFSISNRYALDPQMSFVPDEVKATDAAFWAPKPPAKKKK